MFPATAEAQIGKFTVPNAGPPQVEPGANPTCDLQTIAFHKNKAKRVIRRAYKTTGNRWKTAHPFTKKHAKRVKQHKRCIFVRKHRKDIGQYRKKKLDKFREWRHDKRQDNDGGSWCSPDPHPAGGGCWEIPLVCVLNESGGSWTAVGGAGELGPYQFHNKPVPWPVNSRGDALAHHDLAEAMYAASGLGPWFAPGC